MATNNAVNGPFPLSATQGGLGVASPTIHGIILAQGSSATTTLVLGAGQVPIGVAGGDPIAGTVDLLTWTDVTGTSASMVANSGYTANNAGLVTLTLPTTMAYGTTLEIAGVGAGGWKIAQNASQLIHFGNTTTTTGTGGSLASTNQWDGIKLLCVVANTTFTALHGVGNLTVV